ncbi:hypothetical protein Tco_0708650 [Tanacetum coccineum]
MEQMRLSIRRGGDSVERAITTVASLEATQDSDNIIRTQTTVMPNVNIPQGMDTCGSPRRQDTMGGALAQTRSERVLEKPNEPPLSEGHPFGSGEGRMEHSFELMDNIPSIPHDSPLTGGYTLRSDEDKDFKELDDHMENVEEETVDAAATRVSTVSAPVSTAGKAKEKGVAIIDVEDSSRIVRPVRSSTTLQPLPTIDPKDKGKGVLVEEEPVKIKMRDQELERSQQERQRQEDDTNAALAKEFNEIQARIDADHELAVRLTHKEQEKYTIEERARLLAEFFDQRKKQLATARAEAIRNKPPTKTQVRNRMITYLKHMGKYTHQQLKNKTYEEIQRLYEKEKRWIDDFQPMDTEAIKDSEKKVDSSSKPAGGSRKKTLARKRAGEKKSEESAKKQKLEDVAEEQESAKSDEEAAADYEHEKEELRMWLTVVSDEEETVDPKILSAKYPIVDWESQNLGNVDMEDLHVYKIIRADGNTSYHKSLSSMLRKFDRQDLVDLHRLVMKRFEDTTPEGYNLLLWGDLKVMFEPNAEDEIWSNQQDWTLISWKLYESCGVHTLLMDGTLTSFNMLVEKRYPLIKEMLQKMLNWKLEAEAESTMAFELLKFIKSQLEE